MEQMYANPLECCEGQLQWIFSEFCQSQSLGNSCYGGTRKFYRGPGNVCVRDCEESSSDPQCGGIVNGDWVRLYEDAG